MLIQRYKCCHMPVLYDWLGETGRNGPWDIHLVMRECSFGQSSDGLVTDYLPATPWAPGISTDPFTAKETRQTVKNNYTVKSWKGKGERHPHCRSQQAARDKVMARKARSQSNEARNTSRNKMCLTCPHHKWSLCWPRRLSLHRSSSSLYTSHPYLQYWKVFFLPASAAQRLPAAD